MPDRKPASGTNRSTVDPAAAVLPSADQRLALTTIAPPHPAVWQLDELLAKCEFRTQARGGPGGQHRNRTASGVFVTFRPMEITAEATEQRNQHRNREIAIRRLRYVLAVSLRTTSPLAIESGDPLSAAEHELRDRYRGTPLKLADDNRLKPAVTALLLNDMHVAGGQPSLVAPLWRVSTSRVANLLRTHPPAWTLVNRIRAHHGRGPLR
ncbi:peptide chain release factor-like protein [Allorhodopirellula solitaria]|uniref:Peptide chain release factor 2 n=1 Tax=Allorhodopirellula solitaria TaxID=2527987 RepID=A0A5C5YEL6_9BACT|nr:peptide chain release factor-like protein [Allorhodopirellula solitaria]TWT73273.1 Peptide chain release factor 2 [Allorhodopirellula solitaria]